MTDVHVTSTPQSVSAYVMGGHMSVGTASADHIGGGKWWVSRVFIRGNHRGKGLGTALVKAMIEAVKAQGGTLLEVAPGGYGEPYESQQGFYLACGFAVAEPGLLHYKIEGT